MQEMKLTKVRPPEVGIFNKIPSSFLGLLKYSDLEAHMCLLHQNILTCNNNTN